MSRACSVWIDELFSREPVAMPQASAALGSDPSLIPSPSQPQQRRHPRRQPLPPNLFEEAVLFTRRSLSCVFPFLLDAPVLDGLMTNGLPDDESEDEEDEAGSSPRPASSRSESGAEGSSATGSGFVAQGVTTLTIHGLPRKLDLASLQEAFAAAGFVFGEAIDYVLIPKRGISREGGIPCRYAFVNFVTPELAKAAKAAWHGKEVKFSCHTGEQSVLRVEISKVQGLDNNVKMNSTDAWLSAPLPLPLQQPASASTGLVQAPVQATKSKNSSMKANESLQTGSDAAGGATESTAVGAGDEGDGGAHLSPSVGGSKKKKRQKGAKKATQWQGQ